MPPKPPVTLPLAASSTGGSSSSCAICSTPLPTMPVRSRMASNSASASAAGPRASSFSRGWASGGRSLMAMAYGDLEGSRTPCHGGLPVFLQ
ncbi:hypothetical protein D3C86_1933960 [compost metagenome]